MNGSSLFSQLEAEGTPAITGGRERLQESRFLSNGFVTAADARGAAASTAGERAPYQERGAETPTWRMCSVLSIFTLGPGHPCNSLGVPYSLGIPPIAWGPPPHSLGIPQ